MKTVNTKLFLLDFKAIRFFNELKANSLNELIIDLKSDCTNMEATSIIQDL